jgi:hypothetical protein
VHRLWSPRSIGLTAGCISSEVLVGGAGHVSCNDRLDFGNVGYDTSAGGGGSQGVPFNGNVGLGPYSACVYSQ